MSFWPGLRQVWGKNEPQYPVLILQKGFNIDGIEHGIDYMKMDTVRFLQEVKISW